MSGVNYEANQERLLRETTDRAIAAERKLQRIAFLAAVWDTSDGTVFRYCAQAVQKILKGDQ